MVVIFSKQVIDKINEYIKALTAYPISQDRMIEKVNNLRKFLFSLGKQLEYQLFASIKIWGKPLMFLGNQ